MKELLCNFYNRKEDETNPDGYIKFVDANPYFGFNFPYCLYIPYNVDGEVDLFLCGLTPGVSTSLNEGIEDAKKQAFDRQIPPIFRKLCSEYGNAMIIPLIPRLPGLYTSYYAKNVRDNDFSLVKKNREKGSVNIKDEELVKFKNIDTQIVNMVEDAKRLIYEAGYEYDDKIVTVGYSASAKMANLFAALHSGLVKMVIAGGTSGLGILPMDEYEGIKLTYPIGTSDVPTFDLEEFKKIKQFYFVGENDINDPAMANSELLVDYYDHNGHPVYVRDAEGNKIPVKDDNGKIKYILNKDGLMTPYFEIGYTPEQVTFIHSVLSSDISERFQKQKEIYESAGIDVTMKTYPGTHSTVFKNEELDKDILEFYNGKTLVKKLD